MSRRYAQDVAVEREADVPARFVWRARLYLVREILGHWFESGSWWYGEPARSQVPQVARSAGDLGVRTVPTVMHVAEPSLNAARRGHGEREVWRVEATIGRDAGAGVFDLAVDPDNGQWMVDRVLD